MSSMQPTPTSKTEVQISGTWVTHCVARAKSVKVICTCTAKGGEKLLVNDSSSSSYNRSVNANLTYRKL